MKYSILDEYFYSDKPLSSTFADICLAPASALFGGKKIVMQSGKKISTHTWSGWQKVVLTLFFFLGIGALTSFVGVVIKKLSREETALTEKIKKVTAPVLPETTPLRCVAIPFNAPSKASIDHVCAILKDSNVPMHKLKPVYFETARRILEEQNIAPDSGIEIFGWSKRAAFHLSDKKTPKHFSDKVVLRDFQGNHTDKYYDYKPERDKKVFWVDFANCYLGGGCFTGGFVQEETMVAEMPGLASLIASNQDPNCIGWCTLMTRQGREDSKTIDRVYQGSPTALLITGLKRAIQIKGIYGHQLDSKTMQEVEQSIVKLTPAADVNLLAIAAAKLSCNATVEEQTDFKTVKDLYNTVYSGFLLGKAKADETHEKCCIKSGPIGCGAFYNHRIVACLVQQFAAQAAGVELDYYGYPQAEINLSKAIWNDFKQEANGLTTEKALETLARMTRIKLSS